MTSPSRGAPETPTAKAARRRAAEQVPEAGTALYVHLPFCVSMCTYCDFYSLVAEGEDVDGALEVVLEEARRRAPREPQTVFVGGGTPSLYPSEALGRFFDELERVTGFRGSAREVTLEANPESLDEEKVRALSSFGVDRLSVGVQSLDPRVLELFGRAHSADQALAALAAARDGGMPRFSADLIYAAPGQSVEGWVGDLERVLQEGPGHVSAYQLAYEKGTLMTRWREEGRLEELDEELELAFFQTTKGVLEEHGFEAYEISNFALKDGQVDHRCHHNRAYWGNRPYVGIGPSAVSQVGGTRFGNPRSLHQWRRAVERGEFPAAWEETLAPGERLGESFWLGLRTRDGVDPAAALEESGLEPGDPAARAIRIRSRDLQEQGLLEPVGGRLRLTERGWPLADAVAASFLGDPRGETAGPEMPTEQGDAPKTVGSPPTGR